ncbi:MAG: DEAD/DEAH box helicase [Desulforhabdus sp.]|nr:DEAD/DEAH box helicase [Desulforhabdus sp.]
MILSFIQTVFEKLRRLGNGRTQSPQTDLELSRSFPKKDTINGLEKPQRKSSPGIKKRSRRRPSNKSRLRSEGKDQQHYSPDQKAQACFGSDWDIMQFQVPPENGRMRFHDLDLPVEIMHAIADLGFQYCTPIQAAILPQLLTGVDAAGRAQTGTGKSAVFLISILTRMFRKPLVGKRRSGTPRALILAPTRELVLQIEKDARALGRYFPSRIVAIFGGIDYERQRQSLNRGVVDIMVATPGRLLDFVRQGQVHLGEIEILVIDEADRMLDMGFIPDVRQIIRQTPPKSVRETMLFSATLTPEVTRLAAQWTKDPVTIEIEPEQVAVDTVEQIVYLTTIEEKFTVLVNLILQKKLDRVLIFGNRRDETRHLAERLERYGLSCALLSGEVRQNKRIKALEDFRSGSIKVLVATDVAARGLHVDDISHVINYHLPLDPEGYVHRIGRTGRAGATGTSISFASEDDSFQIPGIEEFIGCKLHCVYPDDELLEPLPRPSRKNLQPREPKQPRQRRRPSAYRRTTRAE